MPECACPLRLCQLCAAGHQDQYGRSEYLKGVNYGKKVEMESEIIRKQYAFLDAHRPKPTLLSTKHQQIITLVEGIMKSIKQDRTVVFNSLDEFTYSHEQIRKKLVRNRFESGWYYMKELNKAGLETVAVSLKSAEGIERLNKKVSSAQASIKKYRDFLKATDSYGESQETLLEALGFRDKLLRTQIKEVITPPAVTTPTKTPVTPPQVSTPRKEAPKS